MRTWRLVVGLLGMAVAGLAVLAQAATKKEAAATKREIVQQPLSALKWTPVAPGAPILGADAWQGPGGSYCGFAKFPSGFSEPKHFHTNDLHVVVLAGKWGVWAPGAPEKFVTSGGYQFIPGGVEHVSSCAPGADCVVYDCGPAAFDIQGMPPVPGP